MRRHTGVVVTCGAQVKRLIFHSPRPFGPYSIFMKKMRGTTAWPIDVDEVDAVAATEVLKLELVQGLSQ